MKICCTNIDCMRQNDYTEFEFDPKQTELIVVQNKSEKGKQT